MNESWWWNREGLCMRDVCAGVDVVEHGVMVCEDWNKGDGQI